MTQQPDTDFERHMDGTCDRQTCFYCTGNPKSIALVRPEAAGKRSLARKQSWFSRLTFKRPPPEQSQHTEDSLRKIIRHLDLSAQRRFVLEIASLVDAEGRMSAPWLGLLHSALRRLFGVAVESDATWEVPPPYKPNAEALVEAWKVASQCKREATEMRKENDALNLAILADPKQINERDHRRIADALMRARRRQNAAARSAGEPVVASPPEQGR